MGHCGTGGCDNGVIHSDRWSTLLLWAVCFGKCSRHPLTPMGPDTWTPPSFLLTPPSPLPNIQPYTNMRYGVITVECCTTSLWSVKAPKPSGVFVFILWEEVMGSLDHFARLGGWMHGWVNAAADGWMDRWWIEGSMHGWKDRWINWRMSDTLRDKWMKASSEKQYVGNFLSSWWHASSSVSITFLHHPIYNTAALHQTVY